MARQRNERSKDEGISQNKNMRGKQSRKDNKSKRVNYDNTRESKFKKDAEFKDPKCTDKSNDVKWYANNPELLRSAASLPFSATTGLPIGLDDGTTQITVPGVMAIDWNPVVAGPGANPINQAKDSIYSYVVHANSRNQSYDAADLMMVILAGAQLFSFLALGIRAYGIAKTYDQRNTYLPDALLMASGFDPQDIRDNLSDIWFDLNEMIARSKQIWIPNTMPVVERWFWMSTNVYMDSETVKGQYYMYVPNTVYGFEETLPQATGLSSIAWITTTPRKWSDYKDIMNGLFNSLINSQDRGIMFGDILKAYGEAAIYSVNPISSDYTVVPVYDKEVLSQIENSTSFGCNPLDIIQDPTTGYISQIWDTVDQWSTLVADKRVPIGRCILNFHQQEMPTPEQIMVATRLTCLGLTPQSSGSENWLAPYSAGTEVVSKYRIVMNVWVNGKNTPSIKTLQTILNAKDIGTVENEWYIQIAFDWAPFIYQLTSTIPTDLPNTKQIYLSDLAFGDYDQYTTLDADTLNKMHLTAVYSEFGVPVM